MASQSRFRPLVLALAAVAIGSSLAGVGARAPQAQQRPANQRPTATFRSSVDLVTVNVVVRDRNGNVVRGLTRDDFTVTEDGRPQTISTFDFEQIATTAATEIGAGRDPDDSRQRRPRGRRAGAAAAPAAAPTPTIDMRGRRVIAMFFDLSSMQPEDVLRSAASARDYIDKRLTASDMIAIVTLSTTLQVVQDFTADRDLLLQTIDRLSGVEGAGFEELATDVTDDTVDGVHGRRCRVRAVQHRPPAAGHPGADRGDGADRAEEVARLLQRRDDASRASTTASPSAP